MVILLKIFTRLEEEDRVIFYVKYASWIGKYKRSTRPEQEDKNNMYLKYFVTARK